MLPHKIKNLKIEILDIEVFKKIDAEQYIFNLIKSHGFKILDYKAELGHPDYKVMKKNGYIFYIEVKTNGDGLRQEQFNWLLKNPNKEVLLIFINQINEKTKIKKIKKERKKEQERIKEIRTLSEEAFNIL